MDYKIFLCTASAPTLSCRLYIFDGEVQTFSEHCSSMCWCIAIIACNRCIPMNQISIPFHSLLMGGFELFFTVCLETPWATPFCTRYILSPQTASRFLSGQPSKHQPSKYDTRQLFSLLYTTLSSFLSPFLPTSSHLSCLWYASKTSYESFSSALPILLCY